MMRSCRSESMLGPPRPERAVVGVGDNCQMSEGEPLQWGWSDAWVLAAIMMTQQEGGSSLTDVVAAADAINHAILMENEVESAVRKLLGAELIATQQRAFFLTEAGEVMKAAKHGGLLGQVDQLLLALRRLPGFPRGWELSPSALPGAAGPRNCPAPHVVARTPRRPPPYPTRRNTRSPPAKAILRPSRVRGGRRRKHAAPLEAAARWPAITSGINNHR